MSPKRTDPSRVVEPARLAPDVPSRFRRQYPGLAAPVDSRGMSQQLLQRTFDLGLAEEPEIGFLEPF